MNIKNKLLLSFLALIIASSSGGFLSYLMLTKSSLYLQSKESVYQILVQLESAQKIEKDFLNYGWKQGDFLENGENELTQQHKEVMDQLVESVSRVRREKIIQDHQLEIEVYSIESALHRYALNFNNIKELLYERGFKDYGVEGSMRDDVHELQNCIGDQEKIYAFSLRRHEKDFMLRKDLKYYDQLTSTTQEFSDFIQRSHAPHMTIAYKTKVLQTLASYHKKFKHLVEIEEAIGLDQESGLLAEVNNSFMAIPPEINKLLEVVNIKSSSLEYRSKIVLIVSILLPCIIGFFLAIFLTRILAKPLATLNLSIKHIINGEKGELKNLALINSRDEIGALAGNFVKMMDSINTHLEEISQKNSELEQASLEEKKRKWVAEGISHFADIMKKYDHHLEEFSYQIIAKLVKYLEVNQGGLFFVDNIDEPTKMTLHAAFAFDRKKFLNKEIIKGEGLVGACWLEKEHVYLTDIPDQYINITSGLGDANPNSILVVPIITDEKVLGAIEIASFTILDEFQIDLTRKVADRIATSYYSLITQAKTKALLEQTQSQSEEMKAQEEELRQNMEELIATQEEMSRKQKETEEVKNFMGEIIDHLPYPLFLKDEIGQYVIVNKAEATLYGYRKEQMVGANDEQYIMDKKELSTIKASDHQVIEKGELIRLPKQTITLPDGKKKVLQTIKTPFENRVTKKKNILGISIDITEVEKVQEELHFTREELRKANEVITIIKEDMKRDNVSQ